MSETTQWERVREAFLDLVERPAAERDERLAKLRASQPELARRVAALIEHDDGGAGEDDPAPMRFGPYEVVRPVGRGGMGEVFVARRADGEYEREVAIKLLRPGYVDEELVQRFLRERQMLARLDHEYVAKLLDGGKTDSGAPYLVMEYVEGERADEYAARQPLEERLRLFVRIGEAVAHAHEHGFVHRDLKPSNVLVRADGAPRLLDFGIARVEDGAPPTAGDTPNGDPLTRTGRRLFTPDYASPEQVRGEVATASSDVFSLGVMLYVFLCGESPWPADLPLHRLELAICEHEPRPPSRRGTQSRGRTGTAADLDAIALRCLAKHPRDRYPSVAELCEDVERYLDGRPVRARRTGLFGRSIRLARRRPAVPAIAVLVVVALAAAAVAALLERRDQRRQGELLAAAEERIGVARARRGEGRYDAADAELEAALEILDGLPPAPAVLAEVLAQKGVHAHVRGEDERVLELVGQAERELAGVEAPAAELVQRVLNLRALASAVVRPDEASEAARLAREHALAELQPGQVLRGEARILWAEQLHQEERQEEAYEELAQAEDETRAHDPRSEYLCWILNLRALMLSTGGRLDEAVAEWQEALTYLDWHHGAGHRHYATLRSNLGSALFRLGRYDEARAEFERSEETARELDREDILSLSLHFRSRILWIKRDFEGAEAVAREAVELRERLESRTDLIRSRCQLGMALVRLDKDEGEALLEEALSPEGRTELLPDMVFEAHRFYGFWLLHRKRLEEAAFHLREALERGRAHFGDDHSIVQGIERRLEEAEQR